VSAHLEAGRRPGWQALLDAIAAESDPVRRRNLELVAVHVVAEVEGELDTLMATLVEEPRYRFLGCTSSVGPVGAAAVREHYSRMIASGKNRLDFLVDRVVADADAVVTEGVFRLAYPGSSMPQRSAESGEPVHDDHWYLIEYRCIVVWPIRGDRLEGEDLYVGEPPRVVRALADGEHPGLGPVGRRNGSVPVW
jgi:hypothetical protein